MNGISGQSGDGDAYRKCSTQPGADGFRRDDLRRAKPQVPRVPDGEKLRAYPFTPGDK